MPYAEMACTSQGYFLLSDSKGSVYVTPNKQELVKRVEDMYNTNHLRGFEASMSAAVHFMQFQIAVIELPEDVNEVSNMFEDPTKLYSFRSVSGSGKGFKFKEEIGKALQALGQAPRLITEDINNIKEELQKARNPC